MAGFLDGEGYVTIMRQVRRDRPSPAYRAYISIANTNRKSLNIFIRYYGGKIYKREDWRRDKMGNKWSDAYGWYCPISSSRRFLSDVLPYLRIKTKQAELVLQFIDN